MTTPSPSEFLTFMRTVSRPASSCLRQSLSARPPIHQSLAARTFTSSSVRRTTGEQSKGDSSPKKHLADKNNRLDVQADSAAAAKASKARGDGGSAVTQSDERNSTARAKRDHPEAPDVVIGMQDERGGKGH